MKSDTADKWFLEASDDDLDYNEIENYAIWDCSILDTWTFQTKQKYWHQNGETAGILRSGNDDKDDEMR